MNYLAEIYIEYGVTFPFSGGNGTSIEDAVIINAEAIEDFVEQEYEYIDYVMQLRYEDYEILSQKLIVDKNLHFDVIEVKPLGITDSEFFYFNLSQVFGAH